MTILELLKKESYEGLNEASNKLKKTFLEMSALKSEFDMEKLTVKRQGNFPAHMYHFLCRQYSLAVQELKRMTLDREEKIRQIAEFKEIQDKDKKKVGKKFVDIEISRLENQIDGLEMSMVNKANMCEYFEKLRLAIIELNNNKEPTNEDYQKEEPDYLKWYIERELYYDGVSRQTGIRIGVLNNIDMIEEVPVINPDYRRRIQKAINMDTFPVENEIQKLLPNRYDLEAQKNLKDKLIADALERKKLAEANNGNPGTTEVDTPANPTNPN